MLKKTLLKNTREFLEKNFPENLFLFKKSNKNIKKYYALKAEAVVNKLLKLNRPSTYVKYNLIKYNLIKNYNLLTSSSEQHLRKFIAYSSLSTRKVHVKGPFTDKFLFSLHIIKSLFEKRQTRNSDFNQKLKEKKKLSLLYGNLSNKYIKNIIIKAKAINGNINENLLCFLEARLDVILYRALFFHSIKSARQWIKTNKVLVNNTYVNIASYTVKYGDVISIPKKNRKFISTNIMKHFIHHNLIDRNTYMKTQLTRIPVNNSSQTAFSFPRYDKHGIFNIYKNILFKHNKFARYVNFYKNIVHGTSVFYNFQALSEKLSYSSCVIAPEDRKWQSKQFINNILIRVPKINLFYKETDNKCSPYKLGTQSQATIDKNINKIQKHHLNYKKTIDKNIIENTNNTFLESVLYDLNKQHTILLKHSKNEDLKFSRSLTAAVNKNLPYKTKLGSEAVKNGKLNLFTIFRKLQISFLHTKPPERKQVPGTKGANMANINIISTQNVGKVNIQIKNFLKKQNVNLACETTTHFAGFPNKTAEKYNVLQVKDSFFQSEKRSNEKCQYLSNFLFNKVILKKKLFQKRNIFITDTKYVKILMQQIIVVNSFLLKHVIDFLAYKFLLQDISKIELKLNKCNNVQVNVAEFFFNNKIASKIKILLSNINFIVKRKTLHIFNLLLSNNFFSMQQKKNLLSTITNIQTIKFFDFLFFLKLKKFLFTKSIMNGIFATNTTLKYKKSAINIKPLNLEVSYKTLTIIYLYPPQKLIFPFSLDIEKLCKYYL